MKVNEIIIIIYKRFRKIFLKPIHIYCFHHVSEKHDPLLCGIEDWKQRSRMEEQLLKMQKEYSFISLDDAIHHLKKDFTRTKKYAVLTTDDGLKDAWKMTSWLVEHNIPLTMFINSKYLDGKSYKELDAIRITSVNENADIESVIKRQYITKEELWSITSPLVTVALHGYEHLDSTKISLKSFMENIENDIAALKHHPCFRPYMAYPWGKHNAITDRLLRDMGIIPILMDGQANYKEITCIHREIL